MMTNGFWERCSGEKKRKKGDRGRERESERELISCGQEGNNSAVSLHCRAPAVNFLESTVARSDGAVLYL